MKKLLKSTLGVLMLLSLAPNLASCGDNNYCYFTDDICDHCEIVYVSYGQDDKGKYTLENNTISFEIKIQEGYAANNFKLTINSQEITPSETVYATENEQTLQYVTSYSYSYEATADFTIKAEGTFTQITNSLTLKRDSFFDELVDTSAMKDLKIRFRENTYSLPTSAVSYLDFVKGLNTGRELKGFKYGEKLEFDVFYQSDKFTGDPNINWSLYKMNEIFYHENGEIGYHYSATLFYLPVTVELCATDMTVSTNIKTGASEYVSSECSFEKIDIAVSEGVLTITFKDFENMPEKVKTGLTLHINNEKQTLDLTSSVLQINLKNPWEYKNIQMDTYYEIDLNFYEFDYFTTTSN